MNLRNGMHVPRSSSPSEEELPLVFSPPAPAAPVPLGFPGYLLDPFRHSKVNLKPLQSEQGGSQRGSGKGGMERGIRMESKSGEVCSPLVCNFQNDSRTGAKVRESKALAPQPAVAGKPGAHRTPAPVNQQ